MVALYVVLMICTAMFLFGSYHGIVHGTTWGCWMTGISLLVMFAAIIGFKMFVQ